MEPSRYASLRDYLRVLRVNWWVILLLTLVGGGTALAISLREEKSYEATSAISFQTDIAELDVIGDGDSGGATPEETPQARAQTINDPAIVRRLRAELPGKRKLSVAALQGAISTSLDEETFLVDVTATWGEAGFAAELSNLFSRLAAQQLNQDARNRFDRAKDVVKRRLDNLGNSISDQTERSALTNQFTRLQFLAENTTPAKVVEQAQAPSTPVSPRPVRNTLIGLLLGLLVGVLIAFLRDTLDRRLRGEGEIEQELHEPLIGRVSSDAMGKVVRSDDTSGEHEPDDVEAFRILRQNLTFLAVDAPSKVILVTSALPEEGKSTVAASLAAASAAWGTPTLLLECDLRRPSLAARLGIDGSPGLTDYLAAQKTFEDSSQLVDVGAPPATVGEGGSDGAGVAPASGENPLTVVTAGTPTPQSAELLHSQRMHGLLRSARIHYDAVIIDTSPLLPVADTLELLPLVDCILVCVRSGQTTRDQVHALKATLDHYPERPTGLVVTGVKKRDAASYGYYSYGYAPRGVSSKA